MKHNQVDQLHISIQNKDGIVEEDTANAITSTNNNGVFDILPDHANFITLIKKYLIIHNSLDEKKEIKFTEGVLEVQKNNVNIYLDIFSDN